MLELNIMKMVKLVLNGEEHREDGPAYIVYFENGQIQYERWVINDK